MTTNTPDENDRWTVFDSLAATYRARPAYVQEALLRLDTLLDDPQGERTMIDVGAGTGIFTRQLGRHYPCASVIGIEPNTTMRDIAAQDNLMNVRYLDAEASALPFGDGSVAVVSAASAVHRFNRPGFYAEAARILQPGGILMLIDNLPRPWGAGFHSRYLAFQERHVPAYRRGRNSDGHGGYIDLDPVGDLALLPGFGETALGVWPLDDELDFDRFMALAQSSSINNAIIERVGLDGFADQVQALYRDHADDRGLVRMSFITIAIFARRVEC